MTFAQIARAGATYNKLTKEVFRKSFNPFDKLRQIPDDLKQSIQNHYHGQTLRLTNHLQNRLHSYIDKPSRCGKYTELYPIEFNSIVNINKWFDASAALIVEVGWNQWRDICKVGFVVQLTATGRYLFLCVGADRGIKTMYVTPDYKHRTSYAHQDPSIQIVPV